MFRLIDAFVLIEPCGIAMVNTAGTLDGALDDVPGTLCETLGGGIGGDGVMKNKIKNASINLNVALVVFAEFRRDGIQLGSQPLQLLLLRHLLFDSVLNLRR